MCFTLIRVALSFTAADSLRISTHGFGIFRWWDFVFSGKYNVKSVDVLRFKMAPGVCVCVCVFECQCAPLRFHSVFR